MRLPEILTTLSGVKVSDVNTWEKYRKREIMNLFCEYMYGVRDIERPENLTFHIKEESVEYGMRVKKIEAGFDTFSFPFKLYLPLTQNNALPAFIYVQHENLENKLKFDDNGNMFAQEFESVLPLKDITDRGFAVAVMPTRSIYREWTEHMNYKHGVFNASKTVKGRQPNSWATISAWAWGVSRVLDYLETDKDIDAKKVASIGHSRSGKTALWAGATDERILLSIPNNSGTCGAAVLRGKKGEHAVDINISEWFCENFRQYDNCEELLPVDQHMLLALIAPRYLYVTDSILDEWADPGAEFLACKLASEVYELYGLKGIVAPETFVENEVYHEGRIAFHTKSGDHSQTKFDWDNVMNYFNKIINGQI